MRRVDEQVKCNMAGKCTMAENCDEAKPHKKTPRCSITVSCYGYEGVKCVLVGVEK
jgi:hypothetical protein